QRGGPVRRGEGVRLRSRGRRRGHRGIPRHEVPGLGPALMTEARGRLNACTGAPPDPPLPTRPWPPRCGDAPWPPPARRYEVPYARRLGPAGPVPPRRGGPAVVPVVPAARRVEAWSVHASVRSRTRP